MLLHLLALAGMTRGPLTPAAPAPVARSVLIASVWLNPPRAPASPSRAPVERFAVRPKAQDAAPPLTTAAPTQVSRIGQAPQDKVTANTQTSEHGAETSPTAHANSSLSAPATVAALSAPADQAAHPPARACTEQALARHYPPLLRERGIEGQVLLRVKVDEHGRAAEVHVQGGSGWRLLDEAALRLAQSCPYMPARRGDQTLSSWVEYPVRFALSAPGQRSESASDTPSQ